MKNTHVDKDLRTLEAIGQIYCAAHHEGEKDATGLCTSCRETIDATLQRATDCPFGHEQNCEDCNIHCQRGEAQTRIQEIMRYAAPRMMYKHPIMAAGYLRKKFRSQTET